MNDAVEARRHPLAWLLGLRFAQPAAAVSDLERLRSLQAGWDLLASRSPSPVQQFVWAEALAEIYLGAARLRTLVLGPQDAPRALAALVGRGRLTGRLQVLGVNGLHEAADLLYADAQAASELAEALLAEGRPIFLPRVPAGSPLVGALQAAYRGSGLVRVTPAEGCAYIELDASWAEPERRLDPGRRSEFHRALGHAEELGPVTFEVLAPDPAELHGLLDEASAVGTSGWKGTNRSASAFRDPLGAFYRRFAAAACRQGRLRLCFMRIGARAVAMQLATECGERFWLHRIGYDSHFERCAPGNLLTLHTLRYAAQRGLRSYEFLGAPAPWIAFWTPAVRRCVAVRTYPPTTRSLAALCADAAAGFWRWLKKRVIARTQGARSSAANTAHSLSRR